jgi:tetratricopeptide (TPR) repeat protein
MGLRLAVSLAVTVILVSNLACINKLRAKDRLNEGARAYNKGEYQRAEELFKESIDFNPESVQARLFYANAIRAQYVPGSESAENVALGNKAIKAYEDVLNFSKKSEDVDAAHAFVADLYKGLGQKEEQRNWVIKRIQLANQTEKIRAQSYYTLAVGYWEESYVITQKYLIPRSQPPQYKDLKEWEPGDIEKVRDIVMKGLQYMEESLKVDPKYADSYSYRGLLYREQKKIESDQKVRDELDQKAEKDLENFQKLRRELESQPAADTTKAG